MKVDYVDHMGSDLTVVNAARVSFNKHKEEMDAGDERLIQYLASHGHWTPFAHPQITLRIKAPVFVRTQLFKHKVGFSENEVSRRYVDEEPAFFFPEKWRARPENGAKQGSSEDKTVTQLLPVNLFGNNDIDWQYDNLLSVVEGLYERMIESGVAPEQARMVLPQSMYTEWYWTGSLAAYARVYKLRSDPHAQYETREVASMIDHVIQPLFPLSWKALTEG